MNQKQFLEYYFTNIPRTITIIHYLSNDVYGFDISKGDKRRKKWNGKNRYQKDTIALDVIKDFFDCSSEIKFSEKGLYKHDMKMVEIINEKGLILRLVSNDLKKSFPLIPTNNEQKPSLISSNDDELDKIKTMIDSNEIKNIFIKEDDEEYIKYRKTGTTTILKNYDMDGILRIKYKADSDDETIDKILEIINYYYNCHKDSLIDSLATISRNANTIKYILTFQSGIIYINGNEIYSKILDIREENLQRNLKIERKE